MFGDSPLNILVGARLISETISSLIPKLKGGFRTPPVQLLVRTGLISLILWTGTECPKNEKICGVRFLLCLWNVFFKIFCLLFLESWHLILHPEKFSYLLFFSASFVESVSEIFYLQEGKRGVWELPKKVSGAVDETSLFFIFCSTRPPRHFSSGKEKIYPLKSSISKLKRSFLRPRIERFHSSRSHLLDFFFLHFFSRVMTLRNSHSFSF